MVGELVPISAPAGAPAPGPCAGVWLQRSVRNWLGAMAEREPTPELYALWVMRSMM
jgi:hypothetical protein